MQRCVCQNTNRSRDRPSDRGAACGRQMSVAQRRSPPPWELHEATESFCTRDANGQALTYVYFEDEKGRRTAMRLLRPWPHGALDHHGRDAREHGLGHWRPQHVDDRA
jgi:hypothetical protein